jgi:segregation and condensation protein B
LEKELIVISGRNEQLPGHPLIYSTSKSFMDYFGVNSADDLPKIKEVLTNHMMEGTIINHAEFEQASTLAVTDDGELIEEAQTSQEETIESKNTETPDIVSSDLEISEPAEENESKPAEENEESEEGNSSTDETSDGDESTSSEEQQ